MQDDQHEQHDGQRDEEAEKAAQHRGEEGDGQQGDHGEHHAHQTAQLHRDETVLDVALHGEQHDVAEEDEPAVLKAHHMQDGVDDEDPDQQHQAEAEQETLGDGFVHENIPLS